MSPVKIAVLGAGNRAADYLRTVARLDDLYRLTGVCDANAERAGTVAAEHDVRGFTAVERMLQEAKPDVLLVAIPADGHRAAVEVAAEYGVHLICETPIAPTLPVADAMIAACRRSGVILEVAENVWRWPRERLKQEIVRSGLIGEVTQVHLWYSTGSYHGIAAVRRLIGRVPLRAQGFLQEAQVPPHVDRLGNHLTRAPYELGLVAFAGGAVCVYQHPLHPHRQNRWDVIGSNGAIIGDEVVLYRDGAAQTFPIRQQIDGSTEPPALVRVVVETDPPVIWENPLRDHLVGSEPDDVARAEVLWEMRRSLSGSAGPGYGATNARMDQEVLIAIRESALHDGDWIHLPLTEITKVEQRTHDQYRARYGHDVLGPLEDALRTFYPRVTPAAAAFDPVQSNRAGGEEESRFGRVGEV